MCMALTYFINKKSVTFVASFSGTLEPEDGSVLQRCLDEIQQASPKYLILNLGAVTDIAKEVNRNLVIFQQSIRDKSTLIICNVPKTIAKSLTIEGIMRESEIQQDLMSALKLILVLEG